MINYGKQYITDQDISSVVEVLKSDWLTQGPKVPNFEDCLSKYTGAKYVSLVNSATSALHLACLALGLTKGDWLWTSPISFVASSNCGLYCGANIDFIDINIETYNIDIDNLKEKLSIAEKRGNLPKVIVVVHMCGSSADTKAIFELSKKYNFKIIEDASHAVGAKYRDLPIGSCLYSDICIFSFHPVKIITSAEGGAILTNSEYIDHQVKCYRSHGITKDSERFKNPSEGPWHYEQHSLGFNYRMNDIQAALGLSQFQRVDSITLRRNELANRYKEMLQGLPIKFQNVIKESYSSYHLLSLRIMMEELKNNKRYFFENLLQLGVGVNLHYIPIYRQPYYSRFEFEYSNFPNAETYYQEAITLPLYPELSSEEIEYISKSFRSLF